MCVTAFLQHHTGKNITGFSYILIKKMFLHWGQKYATIYKTIITLLINMNRNDSSSNITDFSDTNYTNPDTNAKFRENLSSIKANDNTQNAVAVLAGIAYCLGNTANQRVIAMCVSGVAYAKSAYTKYVCINNLCNMPSEELTRINARKQRALQRKSKCAKVKRSCCPFGR